MKNNLIRVNVQVFEAAILAVLMAARDQCIKLHALSKIPY